MRTVWILAVLLVSVAARAELHEDVAYTYYPVNPDGAGPDDLPALLDEASPIQRDGRVLHGETHWAVSWHLSTQDGNGECRVDGVSVDLTGRIRLPEMAAESEPLQQRFNRYVARLQRHQSAHYMLGITAANNIERELGRLAPQPDCQTLQDNAAQTASAIEDKYRQEEVALDRKTDYGAEQGVSFNND